MGSDLDYVEAIGFWLIKYQISRQSVLSMNEPISSTNW